MAEGINANGISVYNYSTLLENIQNEMNEIYANDGNTINFDSDTPDGQMTNIYAQAATDVRELATEVYNSFDPDRCSGSVQDSRYALNYIFRKGGTYTIQNIDITVNQTVTLQGLDENYNAVSSNGYTVSDDAGNLWYLIDTTTLTSGTHSLPFRSQNIGTYQPTIGTITVQVTTVLGVTSVNNSIAPTTLGVAQETDEQFRIRRQRSTANRGANNLDVLQTELLQLDGVSDVVIHNNNTFQTDDTGTESYTVWVIIEGGANSDIADLIYTYSCGLPTRGAIRVYVPTVQKNNFIVNFDRANPVALYVKFDFQLTTELSAVDFTSIKQTLAENLQYNLGETAETSYITEEASNAIKINGGGGYALNVEISTDGKTWTDYITSSSIQNKFVVDTSRIDITPIE